MVSHAAGKKYLTLTFFNIEFNNGSQAFFHHRTAIRNAKESDSEHNLDIENTLYSKQIVEISFNNTDITKAEIYWLLKCFITGYSNNSCNSMADLFQNVSRFWHC